MGEEIGGLPSEVVVMLSEFNINTPEQYQAIAAKMPDGFAARLVALSGEQWSALTAWAKTAPSNIERRKIEDAKYLEVSRLAERAKRRDLLLRKRAERTIQRRRNEARRDFRLPWKAELRLRECGVRDKASALMAYREGRLCDLSDKSMVHVLAWIGEIDILEFKSRMVLLRERARSERIKQVTKWLESMGYEVIPPK